SSTSPGGLGKTRAGAARTPLWLRADPPAPSAAVRNRLNLDPCEFAVHLTTANSHGSRFPTPIAVRAAWRPREHPASLIVAAELLTQSGIFGRTRRAGRWPAGPRHRGVGGVPAAQAAGRTRGSAGAG